MSKLVATSHQDAASLTGHIFVQIRDAATGAILVARTSAGIREDRPGYYVYAVTLADLSAYEAVWDRDNAGIAGEIVIPEPDITVTGGGGGGGGGTITGDANGTLQGLTFLIKRGDTLPYLRRQFVDTSGNAVTIADTDTVMFTMRASTDVAMAGPAKTHAAAVIIDASQGIVEYRWATADTNTSTYTETSTLGRFTDTPYAAEFELTRLADGKIETFPQSTYISVSIPPDLDPGTEP